MWKVTFALSDPFTAISINAIVNNEYALKPETDLMLDLKAFVNHNKRLPRSSENRNLYMRMRQFVAKINTANDTKKTREQIVEEYLGIKLSNVSIRYHVYLRRCVFFGWFG